MLNVEGLRSLLVSTIDSGAGTYVDALQTRGAPAAPAASGGPLAALASGDRRLLQQLLTAGQKAGGPQAMMPQPQGTLQQLMMQAGIGGNASGDPFTFLHALIGMDQGQFTRLLATLGAGRLT